VIRLRAVKRADGELLCGSCKASLFVYRTGRELGGAPGWHEADRERDGLPVWELSKHAEREVAGLRRAANRRPVRDPAPELLPSGQVIPGNGRAQRGPVIPGPVLLACPGCNQLNRFG
jgi:hypothetical protein